MVPQPPDRPQPAIVTRSPHPGAVTLTKGPHRWTFACEPGQERSLLLRLADLARDARVPFDWFDAALVSHQLRARLLPGLSREEAQPPRPHATP